MQDAGKYAELEQLAQARLKTNTTDAEASAALSLALTLVDTVDAKRLEAGANQARLCTEQHPNVAVCHLAAAQNLSMQMINMGMVKAMRSVGTLGALLDKGDKAQAKAAYERFIANKRANPANVEDARKSLAKLG